ncbi:unnamed protein product, partial [marine sediment metagenome]
MAGLVVGLKAMWDGYKSGGASVAFQSLTGINVNAGGWNWRDAKAGMAIFGG